MKASLGNIPSLIVATSFKVLRRKILENNVRMGAFVEYKITPPNPSHKKWAAIFYEEIKAEEITNADTE